MEIFVMRGLLFVALLVPSIVAKSRVAVMATWLGFASLWGIAVAGDIDAKVGGMIGTATDPLIIFPTVVALVYVLLVGRGRAVAKSV